MCYPKPLALPLCRPPSPPPFFIPRVEIPNFLARMSDAVASLMRAAQGVLVPPRSRRAAGGTHMGSTARALRQRRLGRAVASLGRAGGTASARFAAIATRRRRPTHGPHGARPPPAPAGEGGRCVARAAQRVLVPPRSRRAAGGTHMGRTASALRQRGRVAHAGGTARARYLSATRATIAAHCCIRWLMHAGIM
jgi:hypothetical protein